ncbi:MAG: hypothetical protein RR540_07555 [Oscillospiraceae bacterium]
MSIFIFLGEFVLCGGRFAVATARGVFAAQGGGFTSVDARREPSATYSCYAARVGRNALLRRAVRCKHLNAYSRYSCVAALLEKMKIRHPNLLYFSTEKADDSRRKTSWNDLKVSGGFNCILLVAVKPPISIYYTRTLISL